MTFDKRITRRFTFVFLWLATLLLLYAAFKPLLQPAAAPAGFIVGIGTHDPSDEALGLIRGAGVGFLRDDVRWSQIEQTRNRYAMSGDYDHFVDEALRNGIQPLLILCYGNQFYDKGLYPVSPEAAEGFARFAEFVVRHFKNRVRYYEVWNEWNVGTGVSDNIFYGAPAPYVALLKKVYPRLKRLDPGITVIGGVISGNGTRDGWMEGACKCGLLDYLDALSYHPYCYGAPDGERAPDTGLMKRIRQNAGIMLRYQKRDTPVFITELGWPTHLGENGSSPRDEARYLARSLLLARTQPFIKGLWWYDFTDDGVDLTDPEENYGIVAHDLTPKPAYFAMRDVCELFANERYSGELEADPHIRILKFTQPSGEPSWVAWSIDDTEDWEVTFTRIASDAWDAPPAPTMRMGGPVTESQWQRKDDSLSISVTLSGMPLVIRTGNAAVDISWHRAGVPAGPGQSP